MPAGLHAASGCNHCPPPLVQSIPALAISFRCVCCRGYRNPEFFAKMVEHLEIDQYGTSFAPEVCFGVWVWGRWRVVRSAAWRLTSTAPAVHPRCRWWWRHQLCNHHQLCTRGVVPRPPSYPEGSLGHPAALVHCRPPPPPHPATSKQVFDPKALAPEDYLDALQREWAAEEERRKAARAAGQGRVEFHKSGELLLLLLAAVAAAATAAAAAVFS